MRRYNRLVAHTTEAALALLGIVSVAACNAKTSNTASHTPGTVQVPSTWRGNATPAVMQGQDKWMGVAAAEQAAVKADIESGKPVTVFMGSVVCKTMTPGVYVQFDRPIVHTEQGVTTYAGTVIMPDGTIGVADGVAQDTDSLRCDIVADDGQHTINPSNETTVALNPPRIHTGTVLRASGGMQVGEPISSIAFMPYNTTQQDLIQNQLAAQQASRAQSAASQYNLLGAQMGRQ